MEGYSDVKLFMDVAHDLELSPCCRCAQMVLEVIAGEEQWGFRFPGDAEA